MTILNHYLPFPAMISLLVKLLDYNNMSYAIILLTVLLTASKVMLMDASVVCSATVVVDVKEASSWYSISDSKNFGMLNRREKIKTGIRYFAIRFRIAFAFFKF